MFLPAGVRQLKWKSQCGLLYLIHNLICVCHLHLMYVISFLLRKKVRHNVWRRCVCRDRIIIDVVWKWPPCDVTEVVGLSVETCHIQHDAVTNTCKILFFFCFPNRKLHIKHRHCGDILLVRPLYVAELGYWKLRSESKIPTNGTGPGFVEWNCLVSWPILSLRPSILPLPLSVDVKVL